MSGWEKIKLGSIATFRNGLNFNASARGIGLAIVGVADFRDLSFVRFDDLEELKPEALSSADALIRKDDLLFVRSNGNRDLIGRSLFVPNDPPRPTSHSGFTIRLRFCDDRVLPKFYAYLLRGVVTRRLLSNQGGGTNINNLNQGILANLDVPLPPLATQRRIAALLGAYDDLIEVNRQRIAVLEDLARGLFEEWFIRFRAPGHESLPMVETPNGPLPKGWSWGSFADLAIEVREGTVPRDVPADMRYVGLEHMPRRSTTLAESGLAGDVTSAKLRFRRGDILFGKIRPYFHKVVWAPWDGICSTDVIVYRPTNGQSAQALCVASSDAFVAHSVQTSNGTKMPRANAQILKAYQCALAPPGTCKRFEAVVGPIVELAASIQLASGELAASRDLLLPRLISGQLHVDAAERQFEDAA